MIRSSSDMPFGLPAAILAETLFLVLILKAGLGSFQFSISVTFLKFAHLTEYIQLLEKCLK